MICVPLGVLYFSLEMSKLIPLLLLIFQTGLIYASLPLVINTWNFQSATVKGTTTFDNKFVRSSDSKNNY